MPTSLTLRSVKGSALTHAEVDDNFEALREAIDTPPQDFITTDTTAVAGVEYVFKASAKLTMPSPPVPGAWVDWIDRSGTTTCSIDGNGANVMGLAEVMTLTLPNSSGRMKYLDATDGWVVC